MPPSGASGPPAPAGSPGPWAPRFSAVLRRWGRRLLHPTLLDLALLVPTVAALIVVEWAYTGTAVPPGPDSGHWVTTAYAYLGRPHPSDFTDLPFTYPPLTFVLVGAAYLLTRSPIETAQATVGMLVVLYGLTTVHLARRFVRSPSGQLLFVGVAVLNGPTIQMLFWGGFPNFLGFALMNEGMVFLLAFLQRERFWDGLGFGAFAAAIYLTHDLSFAIFAAAVVLMAALWTLDRGWAAFRLLRRPGLWAGTGAVVGAYAADALIGDWLGATHANYLFANPTSFQLENLGLIFRIFYFAPAIGPAGVEVVLAPVVALAILAGAFGALALAFGYAALRAPGKLPLPLMIAGAWVGATLIGPCLGYVFHVDTDYPRFAYFFALPVTLALVVAAEWAFPRLARGRAARSLPVGGLRRRFGAGFGSRETDRLAMTGIVLVLVLATATVPSAVRGETAYEISAHDPDFIEAAKWIAGQTSPGAVLTEAYATRWVEAFTDRSAFASGATWIHFYPQQMADDDLSYWALTGHYVATDGHAALAFSGYNATTNDAFPEYVGYDEGVEFPILRLAESSLTVQYVRPDGVLVNDTYSSGWGMPTYSLSASRPAITAVFTEPAFVLNETASLDGAGDATIQLLVLPTPGVQLEQVDFQLAPPTPSSIAKTIPFDALGYNGGGSRAFTWSVRGPLGPLPGAIERSVDGSVSTSPLVSDTYTTPAFNPSRIAFAFAAPSTGFEVQLRLGGTTWQNPGVPLPPTFDGGAFLRENQIRFLLVTNTTGQAPAANLLASEYGFSLAYENPEWEVYEQ